MNSLSWFIYLTQIVENISVVACATLVLGLLGGIFGGMFLNFAVEDRRITREGAVKTIKCYIAVMVLAVIVGIFTPDRRTMLLIAGSEIGQRATTSQAAQDIINPGMDLLKTWIKRETEKLASEATKK